MIVYWTLRAFRALSRTLPVRIADRVATLIGLLAYAALPEKRANMKQNLRIVLGAQPAEPVLEQRVARLARRSMIGYVASLLDFFRMPRLLPRVYRDTTHVTGWEHLDRLLAAGRGAIFATAHFGHWDLAAAAVARRCPPGAMYAVTESFANPRLDALVMADRASYGLEAIAMDDVRRMVRVLRDGGVLGVLIDRPLEGDEGVVVRFFGHETRIPAGVATLAMLARVPILPGFLRRRPDGTFEGGILPPIEPVRTGDRATDVQQTMQRVIHDLEQIIRRSPHQWYMFRAMWPGGAQPRRERRQWPIKRPAAVLAPLLPMPQRDA
jgi:KDO2-lipid IV(A) lauroyltransferase